MSECCASGSCEVCRRPVGYSQEYRDEIRDYEPPWVRQRREERTRAMSDDRIKAWLDERRMVHAAATKELHFQHWGGQNQNGDYAESVLIDECTGDSLAYGLPDVDGEAIVDAHNHFPAALDAIEAALELHSEIVIYALDAASGMWEYDETGERIVVGRWCRGCTPDEAVQIAEDCEWEDSTDYWEVAYPCRTRRALEAVAGDE